MATAAAEDAGEAGGRERGGRCWEREVKLVLSGGCRGEERGEATERESVEAEPRRLEKEIISHFTIRSEPAWPPPTVWIGLIYFLFCTEQS